jgi:hypothetical protein
MQKSLKVAGATIHQVYSVMAKAGPEEKILDLDASAHMTGIKSFLKYYKELQPAQEGRNISFQTDHGDVTCTGVLHVPGLDRILAPRLISTRPTTYLSRDSQNWARKTGQLLVSALDVCLENVIEKIPSEC